MPPVIHKTETDLHQSATMRVVSKDDDDINDNIDSNTDDVYESVGCLFEMNQPTVLQRFEWKSSHDDKPIHVAVRVAEGDPGAVRSGHYLWPAAPALCDYLTTHASKDTPSSLIELGAGCGLVSLSALQLFHDSLQCIVVTDSDPTTLERARDNHETTLEELYEREETLDQQLTIINEVSSIPVEFQLVKWGQTNLDHLMEVATEHNVDPAPFDLVIGSDVIDCVAVVAPLLQTAAKLMNPTTPRSTILLAQSFLYDQAIEDEIDQQCNRLGLERVVVFDELSSGKGPNKGGGGGGGGGAKIQSVRRASGKREK